MSTAASATFAEDRTDQPPTAPAQRRGFRGDVQGLRALAVLLVILYHAKVPGVSAGYVGVDVFFVISGFLITTQLVGEHTRTGRISFAGFYARRIRRLLPAALLVVTATVVVSRFALPPPRTGDVVTHAWFTTFYGINYRLAVEGVDYQKAGAAPSPLQHYWSLAVEEQFYVLWPLLIVLALWAAHRTGRRVLPAVVGVVVAASLIASVVLTARDPALSYFALHTRAWELGAGALVALVAAHLARLDRRTAVVAAWTGFAAIALSAVAYGDGTTFPGTAALLPVGGAALVIAAGCGGQLPSVTRVVGGRAVQGIGTLSYTWYLWHWPVLLLYAPVIGRGGSRWQVNLGACAGALVLAWLTHRFVERPMQASGRSRRAWLAAGSGMSAATAAIAALVLVSLPPGVGSGPAVELAHPTDVRQVQQAIATSARIRDAPSNLTPDVWRAIADEPETSSSSEHCMADYAVVDQGPCVYGDPDGARTVVLFGDSHLEQWQPALDAAGREGGWRVVNWTKRACPLPDRPVHVLEGIRVRPYVECDPWRAKTLGRILALRPDLVLVGQSDPVSPDDSTPQQYADGTIDTVDELREAGLTVAYVLDNPRADTNVPACLSEHLDDVPACAVSPDGSGAPERRAALGEALDEASVPTVDPAPWLCSGQTCPAVVGGVLVYRDDNHVSATYSRWLGPVALEVLDGLVD